MNVALTDALRVMVDERVRSGLYGNAIGYARDLIRHDEEAAWQWRAPYQADSASGESAPMHEADKPSPCRRRIGQLIGVTELQWKRVGQTKLWF